MIYRYVNTASAGGDGTTNDTSGGTAAWASLNAALTALEAYSSFTEEMTLYCSGSAADTAGTSQFDIPTNGFKLTIKPYPGQEHGGRWNPNVYRLEVVNNECIYNNVTPQLRIEGIQAKLTVNDAGGYIVFKTGNANLSGSGIVQECCNCIAWAVMTSGTVTGFENRPFDAGATGTSKMWNNMAIDCNYGYGNDFRTGTEVGEYYNCGAYGCEFSFVDNDTDSMKVVNCLSYNAVSNDFIGTFATGSNYNASTGSGAPGANSRQSQTFTFRDAANDDFHLASGDAGAKGYGLADPASGLFADDIDRLVREGAWDIGPDQTSPIIWTLRKRVIRPRGFAPGIGR